MRVFQGCYSSSVFTAILEVSSPWVSYVQISQRPPWICVYEQLESITLREGRPYFIENILKDLMFIALRISLVDQFLELCKIKIIKKIMTILVSNAIQGSESFVSFSEIAQIYIHFVERTKDSHEFSSHPILDKRLQLGWSQKVYCVFSQDSTVFSLFKTSCKCYG